MEEKLSWYHVLFLAILFVCAVLGLILIVGKTYEAISGHFDRIERIENNIMNLRSSTLKNEYCFWKPSEKNSIPQLEYICKEVDIQKLPMRAAN